MENVTARLCELPGCKKQPSFGYQGERPIMCKDHATAGMETILGKRCQRENCLTRVDYTQSQKYDGYCVTCFVHLFPEREVTRNYKTKENEVVVYVKSLNIDKEYLTTFDRKIQDGCSLRRPDIMIECVTHVVIIEVDENQHFSQECSCEDKRHMQIFQDLGNNRPVVFIRFNPDGYKDSHGKRQPSCFKFHQRLSVPIIIDKVVWSNRLQVLKDRIMHHLPNVPSSEVTVEHLFYNGFH